PEPEPEPEPEPDEYNYGEDDHDFGFDGFAFEPDDPVPDRPRSFADPSPAQPTVEIHSPALAQLQAKLRGFEVLLERGDLDKAAVIASDIQATIADFDPI